MAVQCLLCRIKSRQTQTTACCGRSAHLGIDTIDKALAGILTGCLELRLQAVNGGNCSSESRLRRTLDRRCTIANGCCDTLHQRRHRVVDFGGLLRYNIGQRFHHGLHTRRRKGFAICDRGAHGVQHTLNCFVDRCGRIGKCRGKLRNPRICHSLQCVSE